MYSFLLQFDVSPFTIYVRAWIVCKINIRPRYLSQGSWSYEGTLEVLRLAHELEKRV